ncbi:hypothetical protein M1512_04260 [Patescibacteria group bacterium]|nr:hypothetical protein [Patescibacteria group bacterium]
MSMQSLLVLGRQPALSLAELESLYGADKLRPIGQIAAIVDVDPCLLAFDRLGGAVKFAKVLTELNTTSWEDVGSFLIHNAPEHSRQMPPGKMKLGISVYGFERAPKEVQKLGFNIKQAVRATNRSVRVAPNNDPALSTAQVIHNQLTGTNGWELLIVKDNLKTIVAQTIKVQDIAAYTRRDRKRPARDLKVGTLPPKLAQVIINLAAGPLPNNCIQTDYDACSQKPELKTYFANSLLLDPFCGSGVILQEAAIMGYNCLGSDLNSRMIDFAQTNLKWLREMPRSPLASNVAITLMQRDATKDQWPLDPYKKLIVASETDLGKPFARIPSPQEIETAVAKAQQTITKTLNNLAKQIKIDTRIALAIPAWRIAGGHTINLPLLDHDSYDGYNRVSFQHVRDEQLIYYRPNQVVARTLLVLSKA